MAQWRGGETRRNGGISENDIGVMKVAKYQRK
jgi:hypothetical protein